jgi:hypothetical protein
MMKYQNPLPRRRVLTLAVAGMIGAGGVPAAAATAAAPSGVTVAGPTILGFRKAYFGMTQEQVRASIQADFGLPASAIIASENALQHTPTLTVHVPNLMPGGGTALVNYVFGFQSRRLMEVTILWSGATDAKITPALLVQNGESLQQYFAHEGFQAGRVTGNIAIPSGVLLFRATDGGGNAVLLILAGKLVKEQKNSKAVLNPTALTLAYAADPAHPDIFRIDKGSF